MIQETTKFKKVLWSIDAFEEKDELQEKAARVLSVLQNKTNIQVEPVFVLAATDLNGPTEYSTEWMGEFQENLRIQLEQVLLTSGFPQVLAPKILAEPLSSTSAAIENLLDYALREHADMIIVSSHGRKGLDRLFLGSFAETLLVHSHIPVLVVGASVKTESHISRILFPTEFGENSREAFHRAISLAKQLSASVHLFHAIPMPSRVVMDTGYYPSMYGVEGEMVTYEDFMKVQSEHQVHRAQSWVDWAKTEGVNCDFKVDVSGDAVEELICQEAQITAVDLIVMETQSGPIKTALLGSTARSVVRAAFCPVLVYPERSLVKEAELNKPAEKSEDKTMDLSFGAKPAPSQELDF